MPLILSEIDAVQNNAVSHAVGTKGFSETTVWSGQPNQCGNPSSANLGTCYPPAVNYDPRYYLVNGIAFDSSAIKSSTFQLPTAAITGNVLVRFVNAGLRMHVPSIVGSQVVPAPNRPIGGFYLLAEDGNVLPGAPRIQNEVFLAAGKTYDVMLNPAQTVPGTYDNATYPVFDRQLSLSTNNARDGGMHAYLQIGTVAASLGSGTSAPTAAKATYYCVPGVTLSVLDPSKGLLGGLGAGAYGAMIDSTSKPLVNGTLSLNADGTFIYAQPAKNTTCGDKFVYNINGKASNVATVTIAQCKAHMSCFGGRPIVNDDNYVSDVASRIQVGVPGVLANDTDPGGHPLTASLVDVSGGTVKLNPDGSFTAVPTTPPTGKATAQVVFHYIAINSQKTSSEKDEPATVTITFNGGSGLLPARCRESRRARTFRLTIIAGLSKKIAPYTSIRVKRMPESPSAQSAGISTSAICRWWLQAVLVLRHAKKGRMCLASQRFATSGMAFAERMRSSRLLSTPARFTSIHRSTTTFPSYRATLETRLALVPELQ
jgi:hypothetical protein